MLVNTRLIILVSVLPLAVFPPHCPGPCGSTSKFGGHWTYQRFLRLVLDAEPLPQDWSMLCPLGSRDSKLSAASPQLGSSQSHRHKSARSAHATRHRRRPSSLTSFDAAC